MSDRLEVHVVEYQTATVPVLSERDVAVLTQAGAELLALTSAGASPRSGALVRVGPVCGVLELDACRLVMTPKLMPDGAAVARWLAYARGVPVQVQQVRSWSTATHGVRDVIAHALLAECDTLLRRGLLRGYRARDAVDTALRGRLDIARQLSRRYGQVDQLHLRRFERDPDVWENHLCRAALDTLHRDPTMAMATRRRARTLAMSFPAASSDAASVGRWIAAARYHRLNAHYRVAHHWAAMLLHGGGVDDVLVAGTWPAGSLLLNMNRIWEHAVAALCDELSLATTPADPVAPDITVREAGRRTRPLLPDAVLRLDGQLRPVDAKYKNYADHAVGRDDTHQLLTYAAAFRRFDEAFGTAVIVHPTLHPAPSRVLTVRTPSQDLGRIIVAAVDTTREPADAVDALRDVLAGHGLPLPVAANPPRHVGQSISGPTTGIANPAPVPR